MEPKNLSQKIREALLIYRERFLPLVGIVAIAQVPLLLLDAMLGGPAQGEGIGVAIVLQYVVVTVLSIFGFLIMYGATAHAVSRHMEGSEINIVASYTAAWRRLQNLGGAGAIVFLVGIGLAATGIGIPFAVFFMVSWAFAIPSAVLEDTSPRASLSRSSYLVRYRWWNTFGNLLAMALLWVLPGALVSSVAGLMVGLLLSTFMESQSAIAQVTGLVSGLFWIVFAPLGLIGVTLVYWDLRVRKEGVVREDIARELDHIPEDELSALDAEITEDLSEEAYSELTGRKSRRQTQIELRLRQSMSRIRPWVVVAVILGVLLIGYFGVLGIRFTKASESRTVFASDIQRLSRLLRRNDLQLEALEAELQPRERQLNELIDEFDYPITDDLIAIVSGTADQTGVAVTSMQIGNSAFKVRASTRYETQPMTLTLEGGTDELYDFLDLLYDQVPVTDVVGVRITNVDSSPSSQVTLRFFLSPETIVEKVKKPAPKASSEPEGDK